jgi:hypothetical protein
MTTTKEEKDIVEIKGEVGRIRHHLDIQKTTNEEFANSLVRIENALIGSIMNGNNGLVQEFKDLKTVVKNQNDKLIQYGVYFVLIGSVASITLAGLVTVLIKLFIN